MSALDLVRATILDIADIVAEVGDRLYFLEAPQRPELPALVLHLIDERDELMLNGAGRYPMARFIVDCLAPSFGSANALGDLVKEALCSWKGEVDGYTGYFLPSEVDHFDRGEGSGITRRRLGFSARYRVSSSL